MLAPAFFEVSLRLHDVLEVPATEIAFHSEPLHFSTSFLKCLHYLGSKIALYKGVSQKFLQFFLDTAQSVRNSLLTDLLRFCNINDFSALDIDHL